MNTAIKILSAVFTISFLTGCPSQKASEPGAIVVTTPVLQHFAQRLSSQVPQSKVTLAFTTQGKCLHEHQVSTDEIRTLCHARLVIAHGAGFEPFLRETMQQCPQVPVVEVASNCSDLKVAGHVDPHSWFGAASTDCMILQLSQALQNSDTLHRTQYQDNEKKLRAEIAQAWDSLHTQYASLRNLPVISFHGAYGYLARELGMQMVASFGEELEDITPSAQAVAELIAQAKSLHVKLLLVGATESPDLAATVARETGVRVVPLRNMMEGLDSTDDHAYEHALQDDLQKISRNL